MRQGYRHHASQEKIMGNGSVNAIEELGNSRPASSDPNSAAMQAWKAMIEKSAKKNQEKLLNNDIQRHVIDTNRQIQELQAKQQASSVSVSVDTAKSNPLEGGMQVSFFDKAPGGTPAVTGSAGPTLAPAATGITPTMAPPTGPQPAAQPTQRQQNSDQGAGEQQAKDTAAPDVAVVSKQATQVQTKGEAVSSEGGADEITGKAQLGGQLSVGDKKVQGVSSHTTNTSAQDMKINAADLLNVGAEATVTANTATDGRNDGETGGDSGRQHR
jgi:hypothetical protein